MQGLPKHWGIPSYDHRRQHARKNYNPDIMFTVGNKLYRGVLKNISVGGAFILTKYVNQVYEGELVALSIPYTDGDKHVKRKGRVIWKNNTGFAIGFI